MTFWGNAIPPGKFSQTLFTVFSLKLVLALCSEMERRPKYVSISFRLNFLYLVSATTTSSLILQLQIYKMINDFWLINNRWSLVTWIKTKKSIKINVICIVVPVLLIRYESSLKRRAWLINVMCSAAVFIGDNWRCWSHFNCLSGVSCLTYDHWLSPDSSLQRAHTPNREAIWPAAGDVALSKSLKMWSCSLNSLYTALCH